MEHRPNIDPGLPTALREELGHIAYFLAELEVLRDRGLIPTASFDSATAEKIARRAQIERRGRVLSPRPGCGVFPLTDRAKIEERRRRGKAAFMLARKFQRQGQLSEALTWANHARNLAPEAVKAWRLAIDSHRALRQFDQAIALCEEADRSGHPQLRCRARAIRAEQRRLEQAGVLADLNRPGSEGGLPSEA